MPEKWVDAEDFLRYHDAKYEEIDSLEPEAVIDENELKEAFLKYLNYLTPDWHKEALCVGMDDSIFFGNKDIDVRPALTVSEIKFAKNICLGCPVMSDCFDHAITARERYGIWAGTSGRTRSRIFALIDSEQITEEQILQEFEDGKIDKYEKVKTSVVDLDDDEEE